MPRRVAQADFAPFDGAFQKLCTQAGQPPLYRSKKNEAFLERGMFKSNIHQRRTPRQPLLEHIAKPKRTDPTCAQRLSTCSQARSTD